MTIFGLFIWSFYSLVFLNNARSHLVIKICCATGTCPVQQSYLNVNNIGQADIHDLNSFIVLVDELRLLWFVSAMRLDKGVVGPMTSRQNMYTVACGRSVSVTFRSFVYFVRAAYGMPEKTKGSVMAASWPTACLRRYSFIFKWHYYTPVICQSFL